MKGYRIIVGKEKGSGMLNYCKGNEEEAKALGEQMKLAFKQHSEAELQVDIQSVKLKKCDTSYCKILIEAEERFCLKCEDIMYDAQIEYSEMKSEEELYGS